MLLFNGILTIVWLIFHLISFSHTHTPADSYKPVEGKPNEGNFLRGIASIATSWDDIVDKGEGGVIPSHNTEDYFGEVERGGGQI